MLAQGPTLTTTVWERPHVEPASVLQNNDLTENRPDGVEGDEMLEGSIPLSRMQIHYSFYRARDVAQVGHLPCIQPTWDEPIVQFSATHLV